LEGATLSQSIEVEGRFAQNRVAFIASQMLGALGAAHSANVIHRDLKPENVFLTTMSGMNDIVKLLDFGVAKLTKDTDPKLTRTGHVVGTPAYMAPEYARGRSVDERGDIYAVGCVIYEALAGREPFMADNYNALLYEIQEGTPEPLRELRPDLSPALVELVEKAMAKDPAARFQTAGQMARALEPWVLTPSKNPDALPRSGPMTSAPTEFASELPGPRSGHPRRKS
jgi:serine/threonine-protein kinase